MSKKKELKRALRKATAKLAGYDAARPSVTRQSHGWINSNPNSIGAQIERNAMQWNAEYLAKNAPFAIGYIKQRQNYCDPQGWLPNTGDPTLNKELRAYLEEQWETMGVGCSMFKAFSRTFNVEMPVRGDAGLIWYRDEDGYRLIEFSADQLGELYSYTNPYFGTQNGLTYAFGRFYAENTLDCVGYKIFERGTDQVYCNPHNYDAQDVIYGQDNMFRGIRGTTIFNGTIVSLQKAQQLYQSGMDAAAKQAKTGVVIRNNSGAPQDPWSYDSVQNSDGSTTIIERAFSGEQTQYQYIGDEYQIVKTESPGQELIDGCRYADEQSCMSLGMAYAWLVTGRFDGGVSFRSEVNKTSKEIGRICRLLEPPFKRIVYQTVMDGVDRKVDCLRGAALRAKILQGTVQFPSLPTADAFRESRDDIQSIRAGIDSPQRVLARYREDPSEILDEKEDWAVMSAQRVERGNNRLIAGGFQPTITIADIAQVSDNPQQAAQGEVIAQTGTIPAKV